MTLFVTGATGFIGSHFLQVSLDAGYSIVALRRAASCRPRIAIQNEDKCLASGQLQWLDKEMTDVTVLELQDCDTFVHLAATGVNSQCLDWTSLFEVNVAHSHALWLQAVKAGIQNYVICGSCFEYGLSGQRYQFIPVHALLEPTTPYAASKAAATMAAVALAHEHGLRLTVARPFHVFGEGEAASRFWPALRQAALSNTDFPMSLGQQVRDFVPVNHAAALLLKEASLLSRSSDASDSGPVRLVNVGTGQEQTLRQFADYWWHRWGAGSSIIYGAIPYRKHEVMRYVPLM